MRLREPFCGGSHIAGAALSVAALIALTCVSLHKPWHLIGFAIFGLSLTLLYTVSGLYHSLHSEPAQDALQKWDHASIFLLIAGTYAPVCLIVLRGSWGWGLLIAEYAMAALGIFAVTIRHRAPHWLRITLYICMGWLAVVAISPLRAALSPWALFWLFAGGIVYTLGTVVYAADRPHLWPGRFSAHDLWHVFVLAGSACHVVLMVWLVSTP